MAFEKIKAFIAGHRGESLGATIGFLLAVSILILGFFKTLFVVFSAWVGYKIGKIIVTDPDYFKNLLDRILPPGRYR